MIATFVIAFREFIEAFLIVGVFLGISKKLKLKKEFEISLATVLGMLFSLILASMTYFFGDHARGILTEKNADFLESYLLIFSGIFIIYVIFSLHTIIQKSKLQLLSKTHKKIREKVFDVSLFLTIIFLVLREGFEIALFTASTSLFSAFSQNMIGLILGFAVSSIIGIFTFFIYIRFPLNKIFKATEYVIILLGASLFQNGVTKLFETHFAINLSKILSLPLQFLPDEENLIGHFIQSLTGIDRDFSLVRLGIMLMYFIVIYFLFLKKRNKVKIAKV